MNILDAVDAASLRKDIPQFRAGDELKIHVALSKVARAVFRFSKELLSVAKVMASVRLSQFVKFLTVLESSVHSQYTLQLSKKLS